MSLRRKPGGCKHPATANKMEKSPSNKTSSILFITILQTIIYHCSFNFRVCFENVVLNSQDGQDG